VLNPGRRGRKLVATSALLRRRPVDIDLGFLSFWAVRAAVARDGFLSLGKSR
jgi:hypothetical protein